ncbi:hypothetical protein ZIOFF_045741 [Zingiber officinale]|uniref:Uncharacterized protein n=1 Tax=Zingiber officinale TaxID=94328 RepID=A0A8J5FZQ7_ZINOF|nr:hypothetical protein ZIOFF_045741 [Zingiber officinale]
MDLSKSIRCLSIDAGVCFISWRFTDVTNAGNPYRRAMSHLLMKLGLLAFLAVPMIQKALDKDPAIMIDFLGPGISRSYLAALIFCFTVKSDNTLQLPLHTALPNLVWCSVNSLGWTGLFCPCVLFGRNVERLREDTPWTSPCMCHALCVEGGLALAVATAVFHGIDPSTSFLIGEGLVFAWWMCGIYTGIFRQSLQKKYHLKKISSEVKKLKRVAVKMFLFQIYTFLKLLEPGWRYNSPCDPCMVHCCMHWCAICQEHREMKGRLSDNLVTPMTVVNPPPVQEMSDRSSSAVSETGAQLNNHAQVETQAV